MVDPLEKTKEARRIVLSNSVKVIILTYVRLIKFKTIATKQHKRKVYKTLLTIYKLEKKLVLKMKRNARTVHSVYCYVCSHPGQSTYQISKDLGMTGGSVRHALSELEEEGMIKVKFDRRNPRLRKLTYPVEAFRLLPSRLKFEVKKFMENRRTRIRNKKKR